MGILDKILGKINPTYQAYKVVGASGPAIMLVNKGENEKLEFHEHLDQDDDAEFISEAKLDDLPVNSMEKHLMKKNKEIPFFWYQDHSHGEKYTQYEDLINNL